ncbi:hypothetical protein BVRB_1g022840 [Beta vulgaris subsp. vulgaris]|uniref:Uncharacterized protein n=1 Tax=Beta vulgaris subsp. vulgaris TaxID=3555 RepID=A0A0J8BHN4_BETVV|nr:hypothetical protein BVRB_1g022840 [Beta vulgaris subsp. vulgaris]
MGLDHGIKSLPLRTERPFCNGFWIYHSAKSRYGTP